MVPMECSVSNVRRMVQQFEDHAIVDDIDLQKLTSLGDREVALHPREIGRIESRKEDVCSRREGYREKFT